MYEADRIDRVKHKPLKRAGILGRNDLVVAGIGVHDAAAAGRHVGAAILLKRFEEREDRSWPGSAGIDQLLATAELSGRDIVLYTSDDHRDDGPRQGRACRLGNHTRFQYLSLDLPEPGLQPTLAGAVGNQDTSGPHQRVDDVARAQQELLDPPIDTSSDKGLVELDLGLRQLSFGTGL